MLRTFLESSGVGLATSSGQTDLRKESKVCKHRVSKSVNLVAVLYRIDLLRLVRATSFSEVAIHHYFVDLVQFRVSEFNFTTDE